MSDRFDWQRLAAKLFCLLIFAVAAVALPSVAIRIFMPFLLAALLCSLIIPAASRLSRLMHIGERALRIILLALSFLLISVILFELTRRLYAEISELLGGFSEGGFQLFLPDILDGELGERAESIISELSVNLLSSLAALLGSLLKFLVSSAPSAILFCVTFVMACIYFCLNYEKYKDLKGRALELLSDGTKKRLTLVREGALRALLGCVRAYAVLFVLTFLLSFIGLWALGRRYALTAALGITLVDMLPALGTGIVLLPWALYSVLTGNIALGVGLAVLWLLITIVRAAAEPRVIGESIGISPMLSLVAAYAGFKVFGVLGMLLSPVAAAVIQQIFQLSRREEG